MLSIGRNSYFAVVVAIAALGYQYYTGSVKNYRDNLSTWREPTVNFLEPHPMDQSMLYETVSEILEPVEVKPVRLDSGIPAWLTGSLLRDGPGLFEFGEEEALHPFDGMAMIRQHIGDV